MTQKLINLETPEETQRQSPEIDLSPALSPRLPEKTINERALRYHYTLGEKSPGAETLKSQINGLHENIIRERIAIDRTLEEQKIRQGVLNSYMQARDMGKKLTPEDVSFVQNLMKPQPVSPDSIVEREYAEKVVDQITTMNDNPDMADSYANDPDFTLDAISVAQDMTAKTILGRKMYQDLDAMWKERGIAMKSADWASAIVIPGLDWYRQTNLLKDSESFWLGGNKEDQIQYLYSLPLEQFHGKLKEAMGYLWDANPLTAFQFLDSVLSYGSDDAAWDTAFNVIDIASVIPVATGIKVAKVIKFRGAIKKKAKELGVNIKTVKTTKKGKIGSSGNYETTIEVTGDPDKVDAFMKTEGVTEDTTPKSWDDIALKLGPDDTIRLYRGIGGHMGSTKDGGWFTTSLAKARKFAGTKDDVIFIDVPKKDLKKGVQGQGGPDEWFTDNEEIINSARKFTAPSPGTAPIAPSRQKVREQLKTIGRAAGNTESLPEEILSASGRIEDAADMAAERLAKESFTGKDPRGLFAELAKRTVSLLDPQRRLGIDGTRLADTQAMRLLDTMKSNMASGMDALSSLPRVMRQTLEAEDAGLANAKEALRSRYPYLESSIMRWNPIRATDQTATNNATMEMVVGKPDAGLFAQEEEARTWARDWYNLPPGSYSVRQNGAGYGIHIAKDVDETEVRSYLVTTNNKAPTNSFAHYWMNKLLFKAGSKEKVSVEQRADRALLTAASEKLTQVAKQMTDEVGALTKTEAQSLNRVLSYNRSAIDPDTGKIGKFYESLDEFQTEFNAIMNRAPTLREMQGYFTIVQLSDLEYILTNLPIHSTKVRQGREMLRFSFMGSTMPKEVVTKFEGKVSKEIPWDDGNPGGILVISEDGRSYEPIYRKERVSPDEKAELDDLINNKGYSVLQIANPDRQHFGQLGIPDNKPVHFVLTKKFDARPLRLSDHMPYKPGTHADYVNEFWVKEPDMIAKEVEDGAGYIYKGDKTIFNHRSEAKSKSFADALDRAKYLYRNNMLKEFDEHVTRTLPFKPKELEEMFTGKMLEDGTFIEPRYDMNAPTMTVRSSERTVDKYSTLMHSRYGANYEDLVNSPYNMERELNKRHTGQRNPNAWTTENRGTEQNPEFSLEDAQFLDPLKSTYQSVAKTIRSMHYEDYQMKSVESFIEEFSDILLDAPGGRPGNKTKLYANIRDVLANPIFLHGADIQRVEAARHMKDAVNQLLGVQSYTANLMDSYMQRLANYAFSSGIGDRKLFGSKIEEWIPNNKMQYVKDPFKWMRATAFQTKMGFANPVTWFVQMQGLVPLMSIAGPQKAFKGGGAAYLHMMSKMTSQPNVMEHVAKTAEGFGWKADEWKDAHRLLKDSGFGIIGGSHAYLDDMANPKFFRGKTGQALDAGTFFFKNSEGFIKNTAFFTAYEEALSSGTIKAGKVNDRQLGSVLARAETLALNMTRNNNASYQQGFGSTMTQFWSYQMRTFELFWGRQLTRDEKTRLLLGTSAIYGLPVGAAARLSPLWPLQESLRLKALEEGQNPDEGLLGLIISGAPQLALSMITGEHYDIGQRYGPGGNPALRSAGEEGFWQTIIDIGMGAGGSITGDIIGDVYPALRQAWRLTGVDGTTRAKIVANDLLKASRVISTVNNIWTLATAIETGKFISKNDTVLGPADTIDALLKAITGLSPTHIQDQFLKQDSIRDRRQLINDIHSAALPSMKAMNRAQKAGDKEAEERAEIALTSILELSGLRPDEKNDLVGRLYKQNMDMQGQTAIDFIEKGNIVEGKGEAVEQETQRLFERLEQ